MFLDGYSHISRDLVEGVVVGQSFGMSSRKLSIWYRSGYKDFMSYSTMRRVLRGVERGIEEVRSRRIDGELEALIMDGLYGRFRGIGKGVILVVLGLYSDGRIELLDWEGARGEDMGSWVRLLER